MSELRQFDDDEKTTLSLQPCYAGYKRVELMEGGDEDKQPFIYFQIVEGCGADVYSLTPDEALAVAANLTKMANKLKAKQPEWPVGTYNIFTHLGNLEAEVTTTIPNHNPVNAYALQISVPESRVSAAELFKAGYYARPKLA